MELEETEDEESNGIETEWTMKVTIKGSDFHFTLIENIISYQQSRVVTSIAIM